MDGFKAFDYDSFRLERENKKTRTFFEYIDSNYKDENKREVLRNLTAQEVLRSLKQYINTGIGFQITANNYFSYVTGIFNDLSKTYGIINKTFVDKIQYENLSLEVKKETANLKESEIKEIAADDDFNKVDKSAKLFLQEIVDELSEEDLAHVLTKPRRFVPLMSAIATNLVFDFGLKGQTITAILKENYLQDKNILKINGIDIKLEQRYQKAFELYLIYRDNVVRTNKENSEYLFVNTVGKSYFKPKGAPDYSGLFSYLDKTNGNVSVNKYAYNRIIRMIDKGIDISSIQKLTGFSIDKIVQLLEYYNLDIKNQSPEDLFNDRKDNGDLHIDNKNSRYMVCPVCRKKLSANASEWIVVAYEGEETPQLACKYCEGVYEENNI